MTLDAKKSLILLIIILLLSFYLSNSSNEASKFPKSVASPLTSSSVQPSASKTKVEPALKENTETTQLKTPTSTAKPKTATIKSTASTESPKAGANTTKSSGKQSTSKKATTGTKKSTIKDELDVAEYFPTNDAKYSSLIPEYRNDRPMPIEGKNFEEGYYYNLNPVICNIDLYDKNGNKTFDLTYREDEVLIIYINKGEMMSNGCQLTRGIPKLSPSNILGHGVQTSSSIDAGHYLAKTGCEYYVLPSLMEVARGLISPKNIHWVNGGDTLEFKKDDTAYFFTKECTLIKKN